MVYEFNNVTGHKVITGQVGAGGANDCRNVLHNWAVGPKSKLEK